MGVLDASDEISFTSNYADLPLSVTKRYAIKVCGDGGLAPRIVTLG